MVYLPVCQLLAILLLGHTPNRIRRIHIFSYFFVFRGLYLEVIYMHLKVSLGM